MAELYNFQKQAVQELQQPEKHIVVAPCGCLAKGTPIPLWEGGIKNVEELIVGDVLIGYDDKTNCLVPTTISSLIRTSQVPKPMIELSYGGEKVKTTYDHYFWGGDRYYPLYQLVWGALEERSRTQLKLLCKQYGTSFDDQTIWTQAGSSNEASPRSAWLLQNSGGWKDRQTAQTCSPSLVRQSIKLARSKPYQRSKNRQPSGEPRVVHDEIQCLGWTQNWGNPQASVMEEFSANTNRPSVRQEVLSEIHSSLQKQLREAQSLPASVQQVPAGELAYHQETCDWTATVCPAEPYFTICISTAPYTYCIGREHYYLTHNCGKSCIALNWALTTPKQKWLVVTTPAARDSKQWYDELNLWCKSQSSSSLTVISWAGLAKWTISNWNSLDQYTFIFDEVARSKAGISSAQGRAFLQITRHTDWWAGFTATPGDRWIDFQAYFIAGGYIKNKTQFLQEFCQVQTFKGYPEIVGYHGENLLQHYWRSMALFPDTSQMLAEMPPENHYTHKFQPDAEYKRLEKTHTLVDGTFLDTAGAFAAACRRASFNKAKQNWLADYLHDLGQPAVIFYALTETGDKIEAIARKALPKGTPVLRVYGKAHPLVNKETVGPRGVVVCQWQAGSEALNLQFISQWVGAEMCYAYWQADQGRGRVRRKGQKAAHIDYHYLKTEHTIDDSVYKALKDKSEFSEDTWFAEQKGEL